MADNIQGSIAKTEFKIKNGKLKIKKVKLKSDVAKKVDKEIAKVMNDNVTSIERNDICKKARKEAQSPIAQMKRKISKDIGRDLGFEMS